MSKLSDAINATKTNKVYAENSYSFVSIETGYYPTPLHYEYSIRAIFGTKVILCDELIADGALETAVHQVKAAVINAVFGEFREDLYLITKHLYKRNTDKALEAVYALQNKMFEV